MLFLHAWEFLSCPRSDLAFINSSIGAMKRRKLRRTANFWLMCGTKSGKEAYGSNRLKRIVPCRLCHHRARAIGHWPSRPTDNTYFFAKMQTTERSIKHRYSGGPRKKS